MAGCAGQGSGSSPTPGRIARDEIRRVDGSVQISCTEMFLYASYFALAQPSINNFAEGTEVNSLRHQPGLGSLCTSLFTKVGSNTTNKLQTQHCERKKRKKSLSFLRSEALSRFSSSYTWFRIVSCSGLQCRHRVQGNPGPKIVCFPTQNVQQEIASV